MNSRGLSQPGQWLIGSHPDKLHPQCCLWIISWHVFWYLVCCSRVNIFGVTTAIEIIIYVYSNKQLRLKWVKWLGLQLWLLVALGKTHPFNRDDAAIKSRIVYFLDAEVRFITGRHFHETTTLGSTTRSVHHYGCCYHLDKKYITAISSAKIMFFYWYSSKGDPYFNSSTWQLHITSKIH